jgi:hypothetical protein
MAPGSYKYHYNELQWTRHTQASCHSNIEGTFYIFARPFSALRINGPTSFEVLNSQWTQSRSTIWELSYYIDIGLDKVKQYINETRIYALSMSASQFFVAY